MYPRLSQGREYGFVLKFLAEMQDPRLDEQIARHLLAKEFDAAPFLHRCAATAAIYDEMNWSKTISALQTLGRDESFEKADYAARLARDLLAGQ